MSVIVGTGPGRRPWSPRSRRPAPTRRVVNTTSVEFGGHHPVRVEHNRAIALGHQRDTPAHRFRRPV